MAGVASVRRGAHAEELAATFLQRKGLTIVAKNWRCRGGEIDLVALDGETIAFVEVRFRASERQGGARGSVTGLKTYLLERAAQHFLICRPQYEHLHPRMDVVFISGSEPRIEHMEDAWEARLG